MSRFFKLLVVFLFAILILVPAASAQRRRGAFVYGGGYYGPGFYGPGWGYSPYGYGFGWGYPYGYGNGSGEGRGSVKIADTPKDVIVYVDGGYAGTVGKLKKFQLRPGNHDIELRDPSGHVFHQERVHVIPGKTIEIDGNTGGH